MPRSVQDALTRLLPALVLAFALDARGAELACESAAQLRAKVKDCEGNLAYATAGKSCLDAFDASVAKARESVAKALGAVLAADKQSVAMGNARKGYEAAIGSLGALAETGRRLSREVLAYKGEIVFPDDMGPAAEAGLSTSVFLDNQKCYSATRKLVLSYSELLGLHAKELELTKEVAGVLAARAFKGESDLKPDEILPLLANPAGPGKQGAVPPGKKGAAKQGQSDITGTEKKSKAPSK